MSYRQPADSFSEQVQEQKVQAENLKTALRKLEQKLSEAQSKRDLLLAQHRRAPWAKQSMRRRLSAMVPKPPHSSA